MRELHELPSYSMMFQTVSDSVSGATSDFASLGTRQGYPHTGTDGFGRICITINYTVIRKTKPDVYTGNVI